MRQLFHIFIIATVFGLAYSCKSDPEPAPVVLPIINSISPTQGLAETEVTIIGANFSASSGDNEVKFNSVLAVVVSSTATQIVAKVPVNAGTGKVTVTTDGGTAEGPEFIYLEAPTITSIAPLSGPFGTDVTIIGTKFESTASNNVVKFNGMEANIISATGTQLVVSVPKGAGTGKITVTTTVGTVEGSEFTYELSAVLSTVAGAGIAGFEDGSGLNAKFNFPAGLALDTDGNLYIADRENNRIRKMTPAGVVTTFIGTGEAASVDGNGTSAKTHGPTGLFMDDQNVLYFSERGSGNIRKAMPNGDVVTIAGTGTSGTADGPALSAQFNFPIGITKDSQGSIFVAEFSGNAIRKISGGEVTTFAGNLFDGSDDGTGPDARFFAPNYLTIDADDNIYVTDFGNYRVRKITSSAVVTTIAGSDLGFADGPAASAKFKALYGLAFDKDGNLLIGDGNNNRIRMLGADGSVTTIAGNGTAGTVDGVGLAAQLGTPQGIVINSKGEIFFGDRTEFVIRKIVFE